MTGKFIPSLILSVEASLAPHEEIAKDAVCLCHRVGMVVEIKFPFGNVFVTQMMDPADVLRNIQSAKALRR